MSTPDDHESKPGPPATPPAAGAWLPPRLRDKIDTSEGGDPDWMKKNSSPVGMIVFVIVAIVAVAGVWSLIHSNQVKAQAEAARVAAAARAAVVADSLAALHRADSLAAVAQADSIAFTKLPRSEQRRILAAKAKAAAAAAASGTAPDAATSVKPSTPAPASAPASAPATPASAAPPAATEKPEASESGSFGIDAGEFLDDVRAKQVADALTATTKLAAQVVTVGEGGSASFHVVLGNFSSRAAAEKKAGDLLGAGLVQQAAVMTLPKAK